MDAEKFQKLEGLIARLRPEEQQIARQYLQESSAHDLAHALSEDHARILRIAKALEVYPRQVRRVLEHLREQGRQEGLSL
jgi:hypothetical protein